MTKLTLSRIGSRLSEVDMLAGNKCVSWGYSFESNYSRQRKALMRIRRSRKVLILHVYKNQIVLKKKLVLPEMPWRKCQFITYDYTPMQLNLKYYGCKHDNFHLNFFVDFF